MVTVRLRRSPNRFPKDQQATVRGLGLKRLHQVRQLQDTPSVRGMIFKVRHLVDADPPEAQ